jgi:hypothetical protein
MPNAAIIAAALQGSTSNAKAIYIGGVDVVAQPNTTAGQRYGVSIDTVQISELGPGGVSSMTFVIDDPLLQITIADGQDVRAQDLVIDRPLFLGFIQSFDVYPAFGDQGRQITVRCVGIEAVLDWGKTATALTFPAGSLQPCQAIQSVVANAFGLGPIRAFQASGVSNGNQAGPMTPDSGLLPNTDPVTIPIGTTVREAIRLILVGLQAAAASTYVATVDFTYGLRVWNVVDSATGRYSDAQANLQPDDYTTLAISDTAAGTAQAEGLRMTIDAAAAIRSATVVNPGVISATVNDGTGKMGDRAVLVDTTITTQSAAAAAATSYLSGFSPNARGMFQQLDKAPPAGVHAGGLVTITDARVGLAAAAFRLMQIDKSFRSSGREDWTLTFGGLAPAMTRTLRRFTRGTLS